MTNGRTKTFDWDRIQRRSDGKILLLYRHERMWDEGLIRPGIRVIDVGGWGMLASRLLEEGCDVMILDTFNEDQYYPERVKELPHLKNDILGTRMIFLQGVDLVTCFEMLEHCGDQLQALKNMHYYLCPGGYIAGTVPVPGFCHQADEDVHFLTEWELKDLLALAGFTDIFVEPTPSINKTDPERPSIYFRAKKEK